MIGFGRNKELVPSDQVETTKITSVGHLVVRSLQATLVDPELGRRFFEDAIETTRDRKSLALLYLDMSRALWSNSYRLEDLDQASEAVNKASGILSTLNGDPLAEELREVAEAANQDIRKRRAIAYFRLKTMPADARDGDTQEYPTLTEISDVPVVRLVSTPVPEIEDSFPENGYPLNDGTTTIVLPGLPNWNENRGWQES